MKNIAIIDIDGTVSKVGDRIKHLKNKDWKSFYNECDQDLPNEPICDIVRILSNNYTIVFCTGRTEAVREKTKSWLLKNGMQFEKLLMRKEGDYRHDTIVKPELIEQAQIQQKDIHFVLEDRNSMVKLWRELGITCLQVAEGDF